MYQAKNKKNEKMPIAELFYYKSPIAIVAIEIIGGNINSVNFVNEQSIKDKILDKEFFIPKNSLQQKIYDQFDQYFAGKCKKFDLPLCVKGTDFQKKTWKELCDIDFGATNSYKQLAKKVNSPAAYRAVGMACNKNPIPFIIPCHRVVGSDNSLVGYRFGIDKKEWLLDHEKSFV